MAAMAKNRTWGTNCSDWLIFQKVLQIEKNRGDLPSRISHTKFGYIIFSGTQEEYQNVKS
jgi:hypothetical protein